MPGRLQRRLGALVPRLNPAADPAERPSPASRADLFAISTLLALVAVASWHRLWYWNGLAHLDIPGFYLPWYAFMGEHLRALELPGWNPHLFSGTPFAGDPQSGWMYVPAMVIFTLLPAIPAYKAFLIFHLLLAAIAAYLFARVLGLRVLPSLVAGTAYTFGPYGEHISCCVIHVQLSAWIPVALIGVEMALRAPRLSARAGWWLLTGFAISQMLAGWVGQGMYNGLLVVGAYMAYRVFFSGHVAGGWWRRLRVLVIDGAASLAFGFGLAAAGLLPRLDAVRETNVAGGEYSGYEADKYAYGEHLRTLVDWFVTSNNGWRTWLFYLGAVTMALAVLAPWLARRRFASTFFAGLTIVVTALCLKGGIILELFSLLPRWSVLHSHVPTRVTAVQWIGPAMLAAAACEGLLRGWRQERLGRAAVATAALFAATFYWLRSAGENGADRYEIVLISAVVLLLAAIWAIPRWMPDRRWLQGDAFHRAAVLLLLVAIIVDPFGRTVYGSFRWHEQNPTISMPTGTVSDDVIEINAATTDPGGAGEFLQQQMADGSYFRFFGYDPDYYDGGWGYPSSYREFYWEPTVMALLVTTRPMRLGLFDVQGYNPVQLTRYVRMLNQLNGETQNYHDAQILQGGVTSPLLNMLGVRYVVIPNDLAPDQVRPDIVRAMAAYPEVFRNDVVRVLENPKALPRAWVVHDVRRTTDEAGWALIDAGVVDPAETVVLPVNTDLPPLAEPPAGSTETVRYTHFEPDIIRMEATLAAPGIVVVSEVYANGWKAYVDGKPAPVYIANGVLRGVPVEAGVHEIELRYEPLSLVAGIAISLTSTGLAIAVMAIAIASRRKARRGNQ